MSLHTEYIGPDCLEACVFGWIIVLFFPKVFYILSQTVFLAFLFFSFFFRGEGLVFGKVNLIVVPQDVLYGYVYSFFTAEI